MVEFRRHCVKSHEWSLKLPLLVIYDVHAGMRAKRIEIQRLNDVRLRFIRATIQIIEARYVLLWEVFHVILHLL